MKMICEDCKTVFDESLAGIHTEKFPYGETTANEEWTCCPYCGSTEITEAVECPICGKWHEEGQAFCENCHNEVYTEEALESFLTDNNKWLEFLKWHFDDWAQLQILKNEYRRIREFDTNIKDLTEFCEDEGDLTEYLINWGLRHGKHI